VEWKRLLGGCREVARTIDLPLLIALLILMGAGLAVLHSVSGPVAGQAARFAGGLASMWLLSRVSLLRLRAWTPAIYALSMLPLMAVYVIGTGKYGQRWLNLGVAQDFPQRPLFDRLREGNRNGRLRIVVHANVASPLTADKITGALQRLDDLLPRNDRKFRHDATSTSSTITSTSSGIGTPSSR